MLLAALMACTPAAGPPSSSSGGGQAQGGKDTTGVTDSEITVGMWVPLSGNAASLYAPIGKAHEAFFKMVNEQGGINGRKIKYIQEDDQYDPSKTVWQSRTTSFRTTCRISPRRAARASGRSRRSPATTPGS
jgi:branched-chain amino acid transport system substrate-binding protein